MSANEPPNPYTAPSTALSDGAAKATGARGPARAGAVVLSLLAYPLPGAGLYVIGRQRAFRSWILEGLALWAILIVSVRTHRPQLAVFAIAGLPVLALAGLIYTGFARRGPAPTARRAWLVAIGIVVAARAGTLVVKHTLAEAFNVPSGSMMPTVLIGDQIMVSKGNGNIGRGDVVVFNYPRERDLNYVKRVVAIAGDTVSTHGGSVTVNGVELSQAPLDQPCPPLERGDSCTLARETNGERSYSVLLTAYPAADADTLTVPAGHVFVVGDNRNNSHDSRHFGPVPLDALEGTASLIYFSTAPGGFSRIGHGIE